MIKIKAVGLTRSVSILSAVLAVLVIASFAHADLSQFDGMEMQGRDYHSRLHQRGRCEACHEESAEAVSGYPEDGTCLGCHRMQSLVTATEPESEEDKWQNPHNSLHYGQDVPCTECHGEHTSKEPLCADCHNFDYPNHQK